MPITHISTCDELDALLKREKIVVVDFYATWCQPCTAIAPVFESLAKTYKDIAFIKVDVDNAREVAGRYNVSAMPTFIFFKDGKRKDDLRGANRDRLIEKVETLASKGNSAVFSGTGQTLGGSNTKPAAAASAGGTFNFNPRAKVLLGLVSAFVVLWYLC